MSFVTSNDQSGRTGNANGQPATIFSIAKSFFAGLSHLTSDALSRVDEAEANHKREQGVLVREAAGEVLKGLLPSQQGQQKQLDDLRRQQEISQKSLTEIVQYLNKDRQEMQTNLRRLETGEFDRMKLHPVLRRLCKSAKRLVKERKRYLFEHPKESRAREAAVDLLDREIAELMQELSDFDVAPFSAEPNSIYVPERHEAIRREKRPTNDPAQVGRIADEESPGFTLNGVILEKSTVVLFELNSENQLAPSARKDSHA